MSEPGSEATILHADLDAFYTSVEQRDDPHLRGRPVIVGSGVVLAASYEAKRLGVRTAMNGGQARRICPGAVVVEPRMSAYAAASRATFDVFADTTPLVEALSIDEAFLEVGGLRRCVGPPVEIARRLRRAVRERVGLPITVGVARTKFLAKVASAVAKPDGLLVVPPERELAFLHPLPVERLWGVGPVTAARLQERGLRLVGEVAQLEEATLVSLLGRAAGHHLHALAHNRDPRAVEVGRRRRSIGAQRALGRGPRRPEEIDTALIALVDRVVGRMRKANRVGRTVTLRLRFDDFGRVTRSHTLAQATAHTPTVLATARGLLAAARPAIEERGLTLVGIALANLDDDGAVQLALPFGRRSGGTPRTGAPRPGAGRTDRTLGGPVGLALDETVDGVRARFGAASLTRAVLVGRDPGITVPLLAD